MVDRRNFLLGVGALPFVGMNVAFAANQMTLGSKQITSVSDGNLVLPGSMFFDNLPTNVVDRILAESGVSKDEVRPPCNLTLLQDGANTVLFDAGSGASFMPSAGEILESLEAVGVAPDDVTHVVFTHAHPDHIWGVLDDFDDLVFSQADYMISTPEWEYWTDPNTVNTIGEERASFAVGASRRLESISDKIKFFKDGEEVLPGVMAHMTPGHTPGHTSFEIRDGTNAIMVGGDAIGNHHVALAKPDWHSGSDQDPELGASTRVKLLDKLVADDIALLAFHLPEGGLGRIEKKADGYRFVPKEI